MQEKQSVTSYTPPTGDLAHNPGMCPDLELNWRPFGLQTGTQSTEPHQPGPNISYIEHSWYFHIIPVFLRKSSTTFSLAPLFLPFVRRLFLPTSMVLLGESEGVNKVLFVHTHTRLSVQGGAKVGLQLFIWKIIQ